jgi:hypothetical protein
MSISALSTRNKKEDVSERARIFQSLVLTLCYTVNGKGAHEGCGS